MYRYTSGRIKKKKKKCVLTVIFFFHSRIVGNILIQHCVHTCFNSTDNVNARTRFDGKYLFWARGIFAPVARNRSTGARAGRGTFVKFPPPRAGPRRDRRRVHRRRRRGPVAVVRKRTQMTPSTVRLGVLLLFYYQSGDHIPLCLFNYYYYYYYYHHYVLNWYTFMCVHRLLVLIWPYYVLGSPWSSNTTRVVAVYCTIVL